MHKMWILMQPIN